MKEGVRIAAAVGVGYLLGRTRKLRLALMLAGAGLTGRLGRGPAGLVVEGAKKLGSTPEIKQLTGRLVEAGRSVATSAVSGQVDTLTKRIEDRAASFTRQPKEQDGGGDDEDRDEDQDEDQDQGRGEDDYEDEDEDEAEPARPRRKRRPARSAESPARRTRSREL